jgi:hypothetical protein
VFDEFTLKNLFFEHEYWLLSDITGRRYTWIIDPLDGVEAFRNSEDGNYRITVMLLDDFSPLASFAYTPECEIDGVTGALFETVGGESPLCTFFSLMQTRYGELRQIVARDKLWHGKTERTLILGEAGSLGESGRYFVMSCIETWDSDEFRYALLGTESAEETIAAITDQNLRISYIVTDKAYVSEDLAKDENNLHDCLMGRLLGRVAKQRGNGKKIIVVRRNRPDIGVFDRERYISEHLDGSMPDIEFDDPVAGDDLLIKAADNVATAVCSYYADGDARFLKPIRHRIDVVETYPSREITYRNESGAMVRARITYV